MKKFLFLLSLLTGCASVRYAQMDHGQIVDEHKQALNIVGNPRMTCYTETEALADKSCKKDLASDSFILCSGTTTIRTVADGYFVRQLDDGAFLIDEFGKRYVIVENPWCELGNNGRPQH